MSSDVIVTVRCEMFNCKLPSNVIAYRAKNLQYSMSCSGRMNLMRLTRRLACLHNCNFLLYFLLFSPFSCYQYLVKYSYSQITWKILHRRYAILNCTIRYRSHQQNISRVPKSRCPSSQQYPTYISIISFVSNVAESLVSRLCNQHFNHLPDCNQFYCFKDSSATPHLLKFFVLILKFLTRCEIFVLSQKVLDETSN